MLVAVILLASACSVVTEIQPIAQEDESVTEEGASAMTSAEVFEAIEESVVFILSPDTLTSGSGIVIDGGWILTNAHVVDRHPMMSIGRSDGVDLGTHPVHAVDWVFDLALIGPIDDASLSPIAIGDSAELGLGARVLLAGFPDEDTMFPTPTLTEGIVSRRRNVAIGSFPFLQVDATIAPGQSGGALINDRGELVGISGIEFGEGEFGLAFASAALEARIEALAVAEQSNVPTSAAVSTIETQVGPLRNYSFIAEVDESGSLDILLTSPIDIWVDIQTLGGVRVTQVQQANDDPFRGAGSNRELYIDELAAGGEEIVVDLDPGTYQILVGVFGNELSDLSISSANDLRVFDDVEEAQMLPRSGVIEGNFDWTRDSDQWELPLTAGEEVTLTADGISDTILVVRLGDEVIANSDDEGLGVFGTGSRTTFVAEEDGTYIVEVGTFDQTRWGYLLEVAVTE